MEPEDSLPHSQVPATCPILSQLAPVHTPTSHFLKIHLILSSHLLLGFFPSGFPTKTLYTPLLYPIRTTCPVHFILLDFNTPTIWWAVQIIKLLITKFSPLTCYLAPLRSKRSPEHPTLEHPQFTFFPQCNEVLHPYKARGKITGLFILIFIFLDSKLENRRFCTERHKASADCSMLSNLHI